MDSVRERVDGSTRMESSCARAECEEQVMPCYFFDVHDKRGLHPDYEGSDLTDVEAARHNTSHQRCRYVVTLPSLLNASNFCVKCDVLSLVFDEVG